MGLLRGPIHFPIQIFHTVSGRTGTGSFAGPWTGFAPYVPIDRESIHHPLGPLGLRFGCRRSLQYGVPLLMRWPASLTLLVFRSIVEVCSGYRAKHRFSRLGRLSITSRQSGTPNRRKLWKVQRSTSRSAPSWVSCDVLFINLYKCTSS